LCHIDAAANLACRCFSFFQGGREVSDFISYLKEAATNPLVAQEEETSKKNKIEL
jgi:hypothetical protein